MITYLFIGVVLLSLVTNVAALIADRRTKQSVRRRVRFWCQVGGVVLTVVLVIISYFVQLANQRAAIERQANFIYRLTLNRNLAGIEISYTPSEEKWSEIAAAYSEIESPQPDLPYVEAPMKAQRESDGDHWEIDFEPAEIHVVLPNGQRVPAGNKKLLKLSTRENPLFEEVLKKALFGLRIEWGNGTDTVLDPEDKYYPSAIYVSRNNIKIILRPPLVLWNLNEIDEKAAITFFGRDYPIALPQNFRIRSLDPGVVLDQTIELNWLPRTQSKRPTYDEQRNRKFSGPHTFVVKFDEFDPISGKRDPNRATKPK